jgi:hypothetical protein
VRQPPQLAHRRTWHGFTPLGRHISVSDETDSTQLFQRPSIIYFGIRRLINLSHRCRKQALLIGGLCRPPSQEQTPFAFYFPKIENPGH